MKPLVIGTREDVAGFALAGIEGVVCETREEVARAMTQAGPESLVIVSDVAQTLLSVRPRAEGSAQTGVSVLHQVPLRVILPARS